jgi:hypothetical protein
MRAHHPSAFVRRTPPSLDLNPSLLHLTSPQNPDRAAPIFLLSWAMFWNLNILFKKSATIFLQYRVSSVTINISSQTCWKYTDITWLFNILPSVVVSQQKTCYRQVLSRKQTFALLDLNNHRNANVFGRDIESYTRCNIHFWRPEFSSRTTLQQKVWNLFCPKYEYSGYS